MTHPELRVDETKAVPGPEYAFVGRVRNQFLYDPPEGAPGLSLVAVFFDAGAHTRPHTHSTDQLLHFVSGEGFVHLAGSERQPIAAGGIVIVPQGVVHMHGATDAGPVVKLASRPAGADSVFDLDAVPEGWERWTFAG